MECTGLSTWLHRYSSFCHDGFRISCCNVGIRIKVQRRAYGKHILSDEVEFIKRRAYGKHILSDEVEFINLI
jgi:hypothetical protein